MSEAPHKSPHKNNTAPTPTTTAPPIPATRPLCTEAAPVNCDGIPVPVPVALPDGAMPPVEIIMGAVPFSAQEGAGTGERVTSTLPAVVVGHPAWTVSVDLAEEGVVWLGMSVRSRMEK